MNNRKINTMVSPIDETIELFSEKLDQATPCATDNKIDGSAHTDAAQTTAQAEQTTVKIEQSRPRKGRQ